MTEFSNNAQPKKHERPVQVDELSPDKTIAVVLRLAMELSVIRDRLTMFEDLLAEKGVVSVADVDAYQPSTATTGNLATARKQLIQKILADLA